MAPALHGMVPAWPGHTPEVVQALLRGVSTAHLRDDDTRAYVRTPVCVGGCL